MTNVESASGTGEERRAKSEERKPRGGQLPPAVTRMSNDECRKRVGHGGRAKSEERSAKSEMGTDARGCHGGRSPPTGNECRMRNDECRKRVGHRGPTLRVGGAPRRGAFITLALYHLITCCRTTPRRRDRSHVRTFPRSPRSASRGRLAPMVRMTRRGRLAPTVPTFPPSHLPRRPLRLALARRVARIASSCAS